MCLDGCQNCSDHHQNWCLVVVDWSTQDDAPIQGWQAAFHHHRDTASVAVPGNHHHLLPDESLEMHDLPESGLHRECGESEPQCERHAVEPFPLRVGRQGTVRDLQRRSVVLQATSMASTTKPGPKARATQGSAAPAFRSRSRMKSTVGDDMFPWLRSTSRDTSK